MIKFYNQEETPETPGTPETPETPEETPAGEEKTE
jgi:hypothetical protein